MEIKDNQNMHMDRESLAEKSLSQSFSASNVGVSLQHQNQIFQY